MQDGGYRTWWNTYRMVDVEHGGGEQFSMNISQDYNFQKPDRSAFSGCRHEAH